MNPGSTQSYIHSSPSILNLVYIHGLKILVHNCPEGAQKFDDLLL